MRSLSRVLLISALLAVPCLAQEGQADQAMVKSVSPATAGRGGPPQELQLESTAITGSQELPKLLYIVPWKKSELGNQVGRPVNSLLNEVLSPVDRDEFRRHIKYYETLLGSQPEAAAPAGD